ncbi:MAG: ATP/GTP-binding protein [Luteimonas sp.]|nr:ATP/GTP-binding protein [Luteimonas sp.]
MREHKIVVLGSMGAGKSTLVRAIAGANVVDTEVANTDPTSPKAATTVAMDYADVDLPNGDRLRLYGSPGQARFDFIWPILLEGARGAVVLVDASLDDAPAHLASYLDVLDAHAAATPVVLGLSKLDLVPGCDPGTFLDLLDRRGRVLPVVPVDTRERAQILLLMDVLMGEIESSELVAAHG